MQTEGMIAEPFIAFFLLRTIRRIFKNTNCNGEWLPVIQYLSYGIGALFIADVIFHISPVTIWIWHALLISIIAAGLLMDEFAGLKTIMYAVLPFALISLLSDIFKAFAGERFKAIDGIFDVAAVFAIVWMVAMIFISRKQQRALRLEHEKTLQQEEQNRWMTARKEELEQLVDERTSELRQQKEQVESTLAELKSTQSLLIQSEKMASLGELTAGIAHEIQNPLNFVNNFSEINTELIDEMEEAIRKGDLAQVKVLADNIRDNEGKINHHGKRADAIVKGMLQHSRSSGGIKEPTDINALADEYLRLAYHGLRAKDKSFNATIVTNFDKTIGPVDVISQDVGRVILNLITNAFYAVTEKAKSLRTPAGNKDYQPTVTVSTKPVRLEAGQRGVYLTVSDNGNGISPVIADKIFQPFFTTKPTGQGTGLGLSLSYDIIKAHGGEIHLETTEGKGASFIISLPLK